MSKLKLSQDFSKGVTDPPEVRKSVKMAAPADAANSSLFKLVLNALTSAGIGGGCAWAMYYVLGKI